MTSMGPTPNKRYDVLWIEGDPAGMERRGIEIESLGEQMVGAANLMDLMKPGSECRGLSLKKIEEVLGDVSGDLRTAGERYTPSGQAIYTYARVLDDVQATLRPLIPALEELWATYSTTQQQFEADESLPEPEEGAPDERTNSGDVDDAKELWNTKAAEYERAYDSWWPAYVAARDGVKSANDTGVEDSTWDKVADVLKKVVDVLSYAGIVLAVAACIVGGPFILAAAIIGGASLLLTVVLAAGGKASLADVGMAALGVFPFGKAFAAFKLVKVAAPGSRLTALGTGLKGMGGDVVGAGWRSGGRITSFVDDGRTAVVRHGDGSVNGSGSSRVRQFFGRADEGPSMADRFLRGQEGAWQSNFAEALAQAPSTRARQHIANHFDANGMQDMLGGGNLALDFADNMGKAGAGFAYDRATGGWGIG